MKYIYIHVTALTYIHLFSLDYSFILLFFWKHTHSACIFSMWFTDLMILRSLLDSTTISIASISTIVPAVWSEPFECYLNSDQEATDATVMLRHFKRTYSRYRRSSRWQPQGGGGGGGGGGGFSFGSAVAPGAGAGGFGGALGGAPVAGTSNMFGGGGGGFGQAVVAPVPACIVPVPQQVVPERKRRLSSRQLMAGKKF